MKYQIIIAYIVLGLAAAILIGCGPGSGSTNGQNLPTASGNANATSTDSNTPQASATPKASLSPAEQEKARIEAIEPAKPVASQAGGVFKSGVSVSLKTATPEAKVIYTLDGSDPKPGKSKEFIDPITITASTILKTRSFVPQGKASPIVTIDYTIAEICVAPGGKGPGSRTAPLGSLKEALDAAANLGIGYIKVASGRLKGSLTLVGPIQISGAWSAGFAKQGNSRSIIEGEAMPGSDKKNPGFTVKISGTATSGIKLDHLEIRGGESYYAAGLVVTQGATPSLSACTFVGGTGSYGYGAAINGKSNPSFSNCQFDGGASPTNNGISVDSAQLTLYACVAAAGTGNIIGYGINLTDSKVVAYSTVFAGSSANTSFGAGLYSSSGSIFESCTLWGGSGREAQALFITQGNPVVSSCIIAAAGTKISVGINRNYGVSFPSVIRNCVFSGCSTGIFFDADTRIGYSDINADGKFTASGGKTLASPLAPASSVQQLGLGPTPQCKTPGDAPAAVTDGGLANTVLATDVSGAKRSETWTIGAWEIGK